LQLNCRPVLGWMLCRSPRPSFLGLLQQSWKTTARRFGPCRCSVVHKHHNQSSEAKMVEHRIFHQRKNWRNSWGSATEMRVLAKGDNRKWVRVGRGIQMERTVAMPDDRVNLSLPLPASWHFHLERSNSSLVDMSPGSSVKKDLPITQAPTCERNPMRGLDTRERCARRARIFSVWGSASSFIWSNQGLVSHLCVGSLAENR
jgi:hypothetical protein